MIRLVYTDMVRLLKRAWWLIFLVGFALVLAVVGLKSSGTIWAVERVGELKLRGLTQEDFFVVIDKYEQEKRVLFLLPAGEKAYSLRDLGIELDKGDMWYQRNNMTNFLSEAEPKLRVTKAYLDIFPDEKKDLKATFNETSGFFDVENRKRIMRIDIKDVVEEVAVSYGLPIVRVAPKPKYVDNEADKFFRINTSLAKVYETPLILKVKDGVGFVDYEIEKERIVRSLNVDSLKLGRVEIVNRGLLLESILPKLTKQQKDYFDIDLAYLNLEKEIKLRFDEGRTSETVLGIDDGPNTKGDLANKYLEIDISQQKMYFFIKGELYKEYNVSTGNYYPTPTGQYKILNKAPKAYSDIFGVWMPFWMAFNYAEDIGAYLGIHELPYVLGSDGEKTYRFGYYIGRKMTGGCVAMEPKDSKEIYNLSEVGMLINIVP